MILKGSQRGNGADLAIHLMNGFDNQRIEVAEIYGAVSGDLMGAFAEFEAVSLGTKAKDYLYSLSINPPSELTREQYFDAISTIEHRLGLTDQPRAVVFHVKQDQDGIGREHAHVVWSRIDAEKMRAIHMAHDHRKLMDLACELAHKFDLDLPPGLRAWEEKQKREKDKLEATLAENAQEQETGISPEQRREEITAAYKQSDSAETFRNALEQNCYVLAKGDRRSFVIVDRFENVHSLSRYVKGHSAKEIKKRLAAIKLEELPSVDQAKEIMRARAMAQQEAEQDHRDNAHEQDENRRLQFEAMLAEKQAARRLELRQEEQELLTRHQAERLALNAAQASEGRGLISRARSAVADLIRRTPALRSVLSHIVKRTHLDPKERHALEREALARRHARERRSAERRKSFLERIEKRERRSLERKLRNMRRLQLAAARLEKQHELQEIRAAENRAMQDFYEAARDMGLWRQRSFSEGELSEGFNEQAGFEPRDHGSGDEDESLAPDWNVDANDGDDDDNGGPQRRRMRGKRKGFRRGL